LLLAYLTLMECLRRMVWILEALRQLAALRLTHVHYLELETAIWA
jgi:hypothetical protein